ncbi:glycosyltransferase involved in cell wall biosynthesis [Kibdelosporangium banguiense]|uniref:Glycosyltransferase involved in cell wall biosynthesis n=1 Tax=Kibdelosporangium banguiense TaxID=1365924 RepID=A0ABS4TCS8_9PSEU|nr:glycosyltransferase family 4 protein [Kibdelosporangium banguiense]MBP2322229.1 glycosyltransferase involved in cell wall biosynthesis [Kibdelosporangium banguiense]
MRVLWLSPWMRTLSRVHVEALRDAGHECLLITSDQHYEKMSPLPYERVLDPRPKDMRTIGPLLRTVREVKRWQPSVVVVELVWDPRWLMLARLAPMVHVIHDDAPHDQTEVRPAWQRRLFNRFSNRATRVVAFSEYVAKRLPYPASVVPLTSDVREKDLPERSTDRRDFVLYGRMSPYKNVPIALRAWEKHLLSGQHKGDRLLLLGDGPLDVSEQDLPPRCEWRRERYSYSDVLPILGRAKGSIVHYRNASQSGVQLLSMQLGVTPVVSDSGGLPEFQPPGEPGIGVDDVDGLAAAFSELADPEVALRRGDASRTHFEREFSASHVVERLADVLAQAAKL